MNFSKKYGQKIDTKIVRYGNEARQENDLKKNGTKKGKHKWYQKCQKRNGIRYGKNNTKDSTKTSVGEIGKNEKYFTCVRKKKRRVTILRGKCARSPVSTRKALECFLEVGKRFGAFQRGERKLNCPETRMAPKTYRKIFERSSSNLFIPATTSKMDSSSRFHVGSIRVSLVRGNRTPSIIVIRDCVTRINVYSFVITKNSSENFQQRNDGRKLRGDSCGSPYRSRKSFIVY